MLAVTSCNNPSIMFKSKRNYPYAELEKIQRETEYKVGINDNISIQMSPNKGAMLLEQGGNGSSTGAITVQQGGAGSSTSFNATVDFDGTIKMPLLGRVKVQGLSMRDCELLFEELYKQFYVEPYVKVQILNKRIFIFPGSGGTASVVSLRYNNTTLLEVLATIGGLQGLARAHRIKLIRGDLSNPQVYLIDLSRLKNLKDGGIVMQGNDIIYIDSRNDLVINFFNRIGPYLGLLNLTLLVYAIIPK